MYDLLLETLDASAKTRGIPQKHDINMIPCPSFFFVYKVSVACTDTTVYSDAIPIPLKWILTNLVSPPWLAESFNHVGSRRMKAGMIIAKNCLWVKIILYSHFSHLNVIGTRKRHNTSICRLSEFEMMIFWWGNCSQIRIYPPDCSIFIMAPWVWLTVVMDVNGSWLNQASQRDGGELSRPKLRGDGPSMWLHIRSWDNNHDSPVDARYCNVILPPSSTLPPYLPLLLALVEPPSIALYYVVKQPIGMLGV